MHFLDYKEWLLHLAIRYHQRKTWIKYDSFKLGVPWTGFKELNLRAQLALVVMNAQKGMSTQEFKLKLSYNARVNGQLFEAASEN